jgi:hypothetical protein
VKLREGIHTIRILFLQVIAKGLRKIHVPPTLQYVSVDLKLVNRSINFLIDELTKGLKALSKVKRAFYFLHLVLWIQALSKRLSNLLTKVNWPFSKRSFQTVNCKYILFWLRIIFCRSFSTFHQYPKVSLLCP